MHSIGLVSFDLRFAVSYLYVYIYMCVCAKGYIYMIDCPSKMIDGWAKFKPSALHKIKKTSP